MLFHVKQEIGCFSPGEVGMSIGAFNIIPGHLAHVRIVEAKPFTLREAANVGTVMATAGGS